LDSQNGDGKFSARPRGEGRFKGFFDIKRETTNGYVARRKFDMIAKFMEGGRTARFAHKPA